MNKQDALNFARETLDELGFQHINVVFNGRLINTAGRAHGFYKTVQAVVNGINNYHHKIDLSTKFFELNNEDICMEIILHEIGHCMTDPNFQMHGYEWQRNVISIGGRPLRFTPRQAIRPVSVNPKWTGTCPSCGAEEYRARETRAIGRSSCGQCEKKYNPDKILRWVKNY